MPVRGQQAFARLKRQIRELPLTLRHEVAQAAAPATTQLTRQAFEFGESVYGDPRPTSKVTGEPLTLYKTGATAAALRFVANGTIVRCVLPTPWSKYLVGKYGIMPSGAVPASWTRRLNEIVAEVKVP